MPLTESLRYAMLVDVAAARSPSAGSRMGRPARRAQLSRDVIVEAALRVAATNSREGLTLSRLGQELDADPTGIYRHFRDRDDLLLAVADRMLGEMLEGLPTTGDWKHRLRALLLATVETFERYPAVGAEVAARTTRQENEFRAADTLLGLLREAGLQGRELVVYYRTVADLILSYAGMHASYSMLAPEVRAADELSWSREYRAADPAMFPDLAAAGPELAALQEVEIVERVFDVIITAIEARQQT
jgi:AcrR family transcriptional regulator